MQGELQRLLYPAFILCYLRLVKHSASAEAQQMLAKHRTRFVGTTQRPAQARLQVQSRSPMPHPTSFEEFTSLCFLPFFMLCEAQHMLPSQSRMILFR